MATIDQEGMLIDSRVTLRRFRAIEHGDLDRVAGIIIHQTDSPTAQSTFNAYATGGNGAHFLIDRNGDLYQTASARKRCYHVGRRIKSRCLALPGDQCKDPALAHALTLTWSSRIAAIDRIERAKNYPDRFPTNSDSLGIELVGRSIDESTYEPVTAVQNTRLRWLLEVLYAGFSIGVIDVFRHPEVSYKKSALKNPLIRPARTPLAAFRPR